MIISFKTLELVHYDQIILILELIFQCEDCYFILAKKNSRVLRKFCRSDISDFFSRVCGTKLKIWICSICSFLVALGKQESYPMAEILSMYSHKTLMLSHYDSYSRKVTCIAVEASPQFC